ncbi:MAG: gliding motility-associated C-terminal domain-containing protein [Flavobacteriales bacterium]|nr:gliding motility-associated C-terminal domain-containing protein [Flavobacteriales bacterium]
MNLFLLSLLKHPNLVVNKTRVFLVLHFIICLSLKGQGFDNNHLEVDTIYICRADSIKIEAKNITTQIWGGDQDFLTLNKSTIQVSPDQDAYYFVGSEDGYTVGQNIIINGDFEQGGVGFASGYTDGCALNVLNEGRYCVSSNPRATHWGFKTCGDHTTGSGNMMVVNAATQVGISVWCQTVNVEPATDYEFSGWITSVHPSNPAILEFKINDVLMGSRLTANTTTCQWNQYAAQWNSGLSTSAEICVVNQNIIAGGNDFAIDDISFAPINQIISGRDSILVIVNNKPDIDLGNDTTICGKEVLTLTPGLGYKNYKWTTGESTHKINVDWSASFEVEVTNNNGCKQMDSIKVTKAPFPLVSIGKDTSICANSTITLKATVGGKWNWSTGDKTQSITVNSSSDYNVTVTNEFGCKGYDTIYLSVLDTPDIEIIDIGGQDYYCFDNARPKLQVIGEDAELVNLEWLHSNRHKDIMEPDYPGVYTLFASNEKCISSYQIEINSYCEGQLFIPNAFTPNGDGKNDEFKTKFRQDSFHFDDYSLQIFNRWGEMMFESSDPNEGWDGTKNGIVAQLDIYVYKLSYTQLNPYKQNNHRVSSGTVTLIR